jgi:hypothetical protein
MGLEVGSTVGKHINQIKIRVSELPETLIIPMVGDARLERAAFGSGDQRSIHLS